MAFTPLDAHFKLGKQQTPPVIEYQRPGYTGKIPKNLFPAPPVIIMQDGYCLPTQMSDLLKDRGNAQALYNVNALNLGTFNNCYKYDADGEGVIAANAGGSGTHGMVRYMIEWHQITP